MFKSPANVWVCAAIKPGQRAKRAGGTKARAASPVWRRDELSKCLKRLALYPERTAGCKRSADACARKLKKLDAEALQLDKKLTGHEDGACQFANGIGGKLEGSGYVQIVAAQVQNRFGALPPGLSMNL
ncbi:hypothetical protein [Paenibacillus contaminans]|uniref:Uncharacterized protein n=1 Tax=Paenibacillus contaminans TaxID=450362 RepID=A0A329LYB8_9BACL|nr:hypothetical protein [Paenibacillus contaminans]RAV12468.1 hypothetical protein DQG23_34615 [Paenibacillus contaminans]